MLLEVQNETCSYILCLLGYIAYGVHLCNQIMVFQGKPKDGHTAHSVVGTGLYRVREQFADMFGCFLNSEREGCGNDLAVPILAWPPV